MNYHPWITDYCYRAYSRWTPCVRRLPWYSNGGGLYHGGSHPINVSDTTLTFLRAYVLNMMDNTVSVIDTATHRVVATIPVGVGPWSVVISPDNTRAYVSNSEDDTVSVIDMARNTVVATIQIANPREMAITPDGTRIYVINHGAHAVSVINTTTKTIIGNFIAVGTNPGGVAITPDGAKAYVINSGDDTVSVIDTVTNTVVGSPIAVGRSPAGIAITPDGKKAYVVNSISNDVSVIDTAMNAVVGFPIAVGRAPVAGTIAPDGAKAYVTNSDDNTVSVIDTATNTVVGSPIVVGKRPGEIAVTPDGTKVYVIHIDDNISVINTATNQVIETIRAVSSPWAIAFGSAQVVIPDGQLSLVTLREVNGVNTLEIRTPPVGSASGGPVFLPLSSQEAIAIRGRLGISVNHPMLTRLHMVDYLIPSEDGRTKKLVITHNVNPAIFYDFCSLGLHATALANIGIGVRLEAGRFTCESGV